MKAKNNINKLDFKNQSSCFDFLFEICIIRLETLHCFSKDNYLLVFVQDLSMVSLTTIDLYILI
jgi:hypothetical protein